MVYGLQDWELLNLRSGNHTAFVKPPETIQGVERDGSEFEVSVPLTSEEWTFINEKLYGNGVKILEVKEHEIDLEDVFMKITKGAVQ